MIKSKTVLFFALILILGNTVVFANETELENKGRQETSIIPAIGNEKESDKKSDKKIIPIQDLNGLIRKEEPKEEKTILKGWIDGDNATGDWKGLRSKLEEHGIILGAEYINDNFIKMSGGLNNRHPLKSQGLITTFVEIDTKKLGLWKGGKLYTNFGNLHGLGLTNDYIGDIQVLSNIDAQPHAQLAEYWYEQSLLNEKIKIKLGRQDANSDFCALENAAEFINSSFGLIPNVLLPTYPAQGLGVSTIISPNEKIDIKYGFFDGDSQVRTNAFKTAFDGKDGAVHLSEIAFKPEIKGLQGNYIAGYWFHTGDFDEITDAPDAKTYKSNQGFYTAFDQRIFNEKNDSEQGLNIIGQFGWAPSDRNEIARYYGTGLKYTGLIPKRNKDVTGCGTAIADVSGRYKTMEGRTKEVVIELFHKIQLTNWMALQPNMQYIFNAGGNKKDAFAIGLRTLFSI